MNCPNCNSNVNQGETYCRVCGTKINIQHQQMNNNQIPIWNATFLQTNNQNNVSQQFQSNNPQTLQSQQNNNFQNNNQNSSNQQYSTQNQTNAQTQTVFHSNHQQTVLNDDTFKEDVLVDEYIGKRVEKLKSGGFSWCTFFFGSYYVLYRKMWVFALALFAINLLVNSFFKTQEWLKIIIDLIVSISTSYIFKERYLSYVKKKVDKIKKKNSGKSYEDLIRICRKRGGTSILPVIIIIGIVCITFVIEVYQAFNTYNNAKDKLDKINGNESSTSTEIIRDGLEVVIPSGFEVVTNDSYSYSTMYRDYSSNSSCLFYLSTKNANDTNSVEELMKTNKSHYDINSTIEKKIINGQNWYYMSKDNIYFYMTINNDKIYDMRFTIYSEDYNKNCSNAHSEILKSLIFN